MWFIYAIFGLIFLWFGDFIKKLMLKKWWDKDIFLFICFVFYVFVLWINYIFFADKIINTSLLGSAFIIWFFDFLVPVWMLIALKYLDSSFTFISIRLISSFLILYIWIYVLWDSLSFYNIIWFFLWLIALYFLSWFSFKEKHKIHKKWILGVTFTIIWIVWWQSYFKYIVEDVDIPSYVFFKFIVTFFLIVLYMFIRKKFVNFNKKEVKKVFVYAFFSCLIFVSYFLYILPNIYILWTLSLSYKILSYSIIVPILLSVIFFKEKLTAKKILAFIFTAISLALFL